MPVLIKAWACTFRCGRTSTKVKNVEKHEGTCFKNPACRACKTCKHDHKRPDPEDCYCSHPQGEELRDYGNGDRITCRSNCPAWEARS